MGSVGELVVPSVNVFLLALQRTRSMSIIHHCRQPWMNLSMAGQTKARPRNLQSRSKSLPLSKASTFKAGLVEVVEVLGRCLAPAPGVLSHHSLRSFALVTD